MEIEAIPFEPPATTHHTAACRWLTTCGRPPAGCYREAVKDMRASQAPTLFLMVGLPGAGKTVRARELAAERGALLMTPDAWMVSLFGQSQPEGKRDVLEGHLIELAIQALRLRLSVVLDFGLWGR